MSKKDSADVVVVEKETNVENNVGTKVDHKVKWEDARENLIIQLKESIDQVSTLTQQIEFHKNRATKIQGVLEVNDQLFAEQNETK